jgi:hypothetical protein
VAWGIESYLAAGGAMEGALSAAAEAPRCGEASGKARLEEAGLWETRPERGGDNVAIGGLGAREAEAEGEAGPRLGCGGGVGRGGAGGGGWGPRARGGEEADVVVRGGFGGEWVVTEIGREIFFAGSL